MLVSDRGTSVAVSVHWKHASWHIWMIIFIS